MKSLLVSCLLLISFQSKAQDLLDLVQQAVDLFQKGDYAKAIPVAEKAGNTIKSLMGEDSLFYPAMLKIQAESYFQTYQYQKAEADYKQLCDLVTKYSGEKGDAYTACINNLATVYEAMSQYERSESLLLRARDIIKQTQGEISLGYSIAVNNLAGLYQSMGQYQKAEPLYIQATNIRKKNPGENSREYANSLNNLATLYSEMGQYEKAGELYVQARDIRKKVLGEDDPDYAASLNNLASVWEDLEDYPKAEALYIQARDIRKRVLGDNHPDYAASLNNLAGLYVRQAQYQKAEPLLLQAKEIWKNRLGENHPDYANSLNNLGALYRRAGMHYDRAEMYYTQAIAIRKKVLGEGHPLCADSENDLALLYANIGQSAKAKPLFLSSSRAMIQNLMNSFSILSEKEKGNYINYNRVFEDCDNSFLYNYPGVSEEVSRNNVDLQLFFKALALADTRNMIESVRNSRDASLMKTFDNWQADKILLAREYALPAENRIQDLKKTEDETEALEKDLKRRSSAFRNQQAPLQVSIRDVCKNLSMDEAAIEFVSFRLYHKKWTDSTIYGAYILRRGDSSARFVPLFEEKQLQRLIDKAGKAPTTVAKNFYQLGKDAAANPFFCGESVYKLVWEPLEPFLKNVKKIAYSPAGKLYGIAFHALPCGTNKLLSDKYQLQQYVSTRQVALRNPSDPVIKPGNIVVFGNPDFSMDSAAIVKEWQNKPASGYAVRFRGGNDGIQWPDLPGTEEEANSIIGLFKQHNERSLLFLHREASEAALKALSNDPPQVLHIATHGFFLPGKKDNDEKVTREEELNSYKPADDPLLRSGLILAGGNYAWAGNKPIEGVEDGIATAYEISQLNLSQTELVVLSACETALGDIKGSEGVFGLQRAFKMAGVKKMIVSLWQVPDKETADLMTSFYTYWISGNNIEDAFTRAQSEMRKKYAPFYWAAFVLVE